MLKRKLNEKMHLCSLVSVCHYQINQIIYFKVNLLLADASCKNFH